MCDVEIGSEDVGVQATAATASSVFEYWGPEGGLERISGGGGPEYDMDGYLEHLTERGLPADSELPDTGASSSAVNLMLAVVFMGVGSALIAVSRRRRFS
jgi:LPXTG-motif cell wall-anchored protein